MAGDCVVITKAVVNLFSDSLCAFLHQLACFEFRLFTKAAGHCTTAVDSIFTSHAQHCKTTLKSYVNIFREFLARFKC